ncbi:MAG: hypothetical protein ACI9S9_004115, partial [Planctomycetota bacterium]
EQQLLPPAFAAGTDLARGAPVPPNAISVCDQPHAETRPHIPQHTASKRTVLQYPGARPATSHLATTGCMRLLQLRMTRPWPGRKRRREECLPSVRDTAKVRPFEAHSSKSSATACSIRLRRSRTNRRRALVRSFDKRVANVHSCRATTLETGQLSGIRSLPGTERDM